MSINDIDWAATLTYAIAAVPAILAIVGVVRGPGTLRSRLQHDADVAAKLPIDSAARAKLLAHVDRQVDQIIRLDTGRRDWTGFVIATMLTTGLAALTIWLVTQDGWYWKVAAAFSGIVTLAAIAATPEYAAKVPRDAKDKPIPAADD